MLGGVIFLQISIDSMVSAEDAFGGLLSLSLFLTALTL